MMKNPPSSSDQLTGYFLSFTNEEMSFVNSTLEEFGYPQDISGVKKWLLDSLNDAVNDAPVETATDRVIKKMERYVAENPHVINGVKAAIGSIVRNRKAGR